MSPAKAKAGERLPYLLAKLKAPRVLERLSATAERARSEEWPYGTGMSHLAIALGRSPETLSGC